MDAGQDGGNVVDGTPLVLEDVQTDLPVVVDVGVEHFGQEADVGGLVGVVLGEFQDQLERAALPRGVVGAEDDGLPHHNVVVHRCAGNARGGIILQAGECVGVGVRGGTKECGEMNICNSDIAIAAEEITVRWLGLLVRSALAMAEQNYSHMPTQKKEPEEYESESLKACAVHGGRVDPSAGRRPLNVELDFGTSLHCLCASPWDYGRSVLSPRSFFPRGSSQHATKRPGHLFIAPAEAAAAAEG